MVTETQLKAFMEEMKKFQKELPTLGYDKALQETFSTIVDSCLERGWEYEKAEKEKIKPLFTIGNYQFIIYKK